MKLATIFPTEEIDQQTRRILNFPMLRKSPVLSRFLEFIVSETVHKRELQIKEYSIAVNVLHRSHKFNPNVDSIVRIHAGRLRRALTEYYLTDGIYDPIIVSIPKGRYVPEFSGTGTTQPHHESYSHNRYPIHPDDEYPVTSTPSHKPLVAIFPFRLATQREDAQDALLVLKDQLSEDLLSSHTISVIAYYSEEMQARIKKNILEAGRAAGADYIINGSLTSIGDHIRVLINLLATATGEVLLCKSFEKNLLTTEPFEIDDDILQNLAGFSGDCLALLSRNVKSMLPGDCTAQVMQPHNNPLTNIGKFF